MAKVAADLLPRIPQSWGQKNTYYIDPFKGRERKWVRTQQEFFQRTNPLSACDNPQRVTPYNSRVYFKSKKSIWLWGMVLPLSFAQRLYMDDKLEDVLTHNGHIYSTSELSDCWCSTVI